MRRRERSGAFLAPGRRRSSIGFGQHCGAPAPAPSWCWRAAPAPGYLAQVGTARIIGPESFGLYMYALAWTTVAATVSTLGFHVSLLRLVPACRARGDLSGARGAIRFATLGAAVSGVLAAAVAARFLAADEAWETERGLTLLIAAAAAPPLALQLVGAATVRALGGPVAGLVPERLGRDPIALAALAAMVGFGLAPASAPTAMTGMLLSGAATATLAFALRRRRLPADLRAARPVYAVSEWLRPTLPLTCIMIADVAMARGGVIVLGLVSDVGSVGSFAVALALSTLVALPRMAVASAFAPRVADLHARGEREALQALLARAAGLSLVGAALVAAGACGDRSVAAFPVRRRLRRGDRAPLHPCGGTARRRSGGTPAARCDDDGREPAAAAMHCGAALVLVVLCFGLAAPFGAVGAAVAAASGLAAWNVAMAVYIKARLGLRPGPTGAARR